jgi:cell division protein FtsQ
VGSTHKKGFDIMKKIKKTGMWLLVCGAIIAMMGLAESTRKAIPFSGLEVRIDKTDGNQFLSESEIEETVYAIGYQRDKDAIGSVDIGDLERRFDQFPFVEKAQVYTTLTGQIRVDITQRKPIIRVFNSYGDSFLIDENGRPMPLSDVFTSRVIVANGAIPYQYQKLPREIQIFDNQTTEGKNLELLRTLHYLAKTFDSHPIWSAQFKQMYVRENGDIELIPAVGNHIILIGGKEHLAEELTKLLVLYREGLNKLGWNEYRTINLKFKNQIVCEKR